jgi:hypothetical protein
VALLCGVVAALTWGGFILTLSVSAWLGVIPGLAILVVGLLRHGGWTRLGLIVVVAAAVTVIVFGPLAAARSSVPPTSTPAAGQAPAKKATGSSTSVTHVKDATAAVSSLYDRLMGRFTFGTDQTRYRIWKDDLSLWEHHPVLGVGLGSADLYLSKRFTRGALPSTYSAWGGMIAETGTLGIAAFVALLVVFGLTVFPVILRTRESRWFPLVVGATAGIVVEFTAYLTFGERIEPHVWALMALALTGVLAIRSESTTSDAAA